MNSTKYHNTLNERDYRRLYLDANDHSDLRQIAYNEAESLRALGGEWAAVDTDEVYASLIEFCQIHSDPKESFANLTGTDFWRREYSHYESFANFLSAQTDEYPMFDEEKLEEYLRDQLKMGIREWIERDSYPLADVLLSIAKGETTAKKVAEDDAASEPIFDLDVEELEEALESLAEDITMFYVVASEATDLPRDLIEAQAVGVFKKRQEALSFARDNADEYHYGVEVVAAIDDTTWVL